MYIHMFKIVLCKSLCSSLVKKNINYFFHEKTIYSLSMWTAWEKFLNSLINTGPDLGRPEPADRGGAALLDAPIYVKLFNYLM